MTERVHYLCGATIEPASTCRLEIGHDGSCRPWGYQDGYPPLTSLDVLPLHDGRERSTAFAIDRSEGWYGCERQDIADDRTLWDWRCLPCVDHAALTVANQGDDDIIWDPGDGTPAQTVTLAWLVARARDWERQTDRARRLIVGPSGESVRVHARRLQLREEDVIAASTGYRDGVHNLEGLDISRDQVIWLDGCSEGRHWHAYYAVINYQLARNEKARG